MEGFLKRDMTFVQSVGQYYQIHPEAIALSTYIEAEHNMGGWLSDYGQYTDFLATGNLPGQGLGFGSMHTTTIQGGGAEKYPLYPDWTTRQTVIARMNFEYAAPLIAADMDRKAAIYEQITGGAINIRDDPVMLSWAYNPSTENVIRSAQNAAQAIASGATYHTFDIYQNKQLGGIGMGAYAQQYLPKFSAFQPLIPCRHRRYLIASRPSLDSTR